MRMVLGWFWNRDERRLRALWRLVALGVVVLAAGLGSSWLVEVRSDNLYLGASALSVVTTLLLLGGLWLMTRFVDRRPFGGLGFEIDRRWWWDFAFGLGLGALLICGIFLAESLA